MTAFFERLGWAPAATALVCPLISERECEGLLYVDRAYSTDRQIDDADYQVLETLGVNLAVVLRPLRLAEQLRSQILAVSHTTLTPITAVCWLAEAMKRRYSDPALMHTSDLILAESSRSADTLRKLFSVAGMQTAVYCPVRKVVDLGALLKERVAPYAQILHDQLTLVEITLPELPVYACVDPRAVGDVFAELASNAMIAVRSPGGSDDPPRFAVMCTHDPESNQCRLAFENSGPQIPASLRERVFELYVSTMGSTGVGLWLARRIISSNGGRISYHVTPGGLSQFEIVFPAPATMEESADGRDPVRGG